MDSGSVMIVDDSAMIMNLLSRLFRAHGCQVQAISSGEEALLTARRSRPDVILLDIRMPGMDGYATCEALKADDLLKGIPVIFLSAMGEVTDKVRGFQVGAADYLTKPFEMDEIVVRVKRQIQLRRFQDTILEQNQALEQANLKLKELDDLKAGLTAMLVHDIRSPLTTMGLVLDLTEGGEAIPRKFVDAVRVSFQEVQTVLDDLLELSRSQKPDWSIQTSPLLIGDIVTEVLAAHQLLASKREVELTAEVAPRLPMIAGERRLLIRLLENLIGNGFKYTRAGGSIAITVETRNGEGLDDGVQWVALTVRDTGKGIPAEKLPFIFDPFRQVLREDIGFGLGLAIVRRIIAQHKGRIAVKSQLGVGTEFLILLPVLDLSVEVPGKHERDTVLGQPSLAAGERSRFSPRRVHRGPGMRDEHFHG